MPTTGEVDELYETGAPPAPPPLPDHHPVVVDHHVPVARPARGYDATTVIVPGPPPGTRTYRLRGTETSQGG
ncbi:MAG: hypothetical protein ACJ73E_08705 [Mycobacteriales bacterium]